MSAISSIDVAMPTWNSESVIQKTLDALERSLQDIEIELNILIVIDNESDDQTLELVKSACEDYGWERKIFSKSTNLPEARKIAIETVETDWFLFLDDDVLLSEQYLSSHLDVVSPLVGAVQGKKVQFDSSPSEWVHKRSVRGGTHATLVRCEAAQDVEFPLDLEIYEDEYLRRHIENNGWLWVFNHQAEFNHQNQGRHPFNWKDGYITGKYHLKPPYRVLLDVLAGLKRGRSTISRLKSCLGYIAGRSYRRWKATQ